MRSFFKIFDSIETKLERYCKGDDDDKSDINDDVKKLTKLLKTNKNLNVNNISFDGWSPLHLACASGRLEIVECLFKYGKADANIKSIHELMTPLHVSCWNGHIDVIKFLIEQEEARIIDTSEFGYTSLHYASKNGQELICRYLCDKGIDVNIINDEDQTALLLAAKHGHDNIVKYLISLPHININKPDLQYCSPLHHACWEGHMTIMKLLIDANAAVTLKDVYDRTALDVCKTPEMKIIMKTYMDSVISNASSKTSNLKVIEYVAATDENLIEQCWDLCMSDDNTKEHSEMQSYDDNEEFQTFLQLLSIHPHLKIAYLINKNSKTLLMEAAQNGKITICKLLLSEGADPMIADVNGFTALHFASLNGHANIVKLLLGKCKMNPDACNKLNRTALHCAAQNGYVEVIQVILDYDGNINAKDKNGFNVFHFACFHNHVELVKYLINETSIDTNEMTNSRDTGFELTSSKDIQGNNNYSFYYYLIITWFLDILNPQPIGVQPINESKMKISTATPPKLSTAASIKAKKAALLLSSSVSSSSPLVPSSKKATIASAVTNSSIPNSTKTQGVNLAHTVQGFKKQPSGLLRQSSSAPSGSNPSSTFREKLKKLRNQQKS